MQTQVNMSMVKSCSVTDCAYNKHNSCHTIAITVGGPAPECDTFFHTARRGGVMDLKGGVGACKVEGCKFNKSLECSAGGIDVTSRQGHAECSTFTT